MKNALLLVIIWVGIITFASGYLLVQREPEHQTFEFSSGGAYHVQGYGEWAIRADTEGMFSVTHNIRGEIVDYGSFLLADEESSELWRLIRGLAIEEMDSSDRLGRPDEIAYRFILRVNGKAYSVSLWGSDAREDERIVALVEKLLELIERHTGEEPVLN
jgi:hypothetical protein